MPLYDQTTIEKVQQANDIIDVISEHLSLTRKGREMVGLCPFHEDHRPSFNVSPVKQIYKCFACGAGGDVFKFIQMRENLTFPQAVERLAERASIPLQPVKTRKRRRPSNPDEPPRPEADPNDLARANAWAARFFRKNLVELDSAQYARDYLRQRSISSEDAEKWQIGLAVDSPDALLKAARERNIPTQLLDAAGLITHNNRDKFVNRLMFPIFDVTGRCIGFGGRTLADAPAKYMNSPTSALFDKSNSIYGLNHARHDIVQTGTAVVVEGYTDVIMAHAKGCSNVVATLGTSFTSGHGRILRRYAKKLVLLFDGDTAGAEAANRALEVCLARRLDIKLATVPEGLDPCDFLLEHGKEGFDRLLDSAIDVFQFKWNRLKQAFDSEQTLAGRKAAVDEFIQAVAVAASAGNLNPIEIGLLANSLASTLALDPRQLSKELADRARRAGRSAAQTSPNRKVLSTDLGKGLFARTQREIIEVLLVRPALYHLVREKIAADAFDVPILSTIAAELFEMLEERGGDLPLRTVMARFESERITSVLTDLEETSRRKENYEQRLLDAVRIFEEQLDKNKPKRNAEDDDPFLKSLAALKTGKNPRSMGIGG